MGKASEWVEVLLLGGGWGGWMIWWSAHRRASKNLNPPWRVEDIFYWALMGLWFGIVATFHWRAFHMPLVFLTVVAFASACLVGAIGGKGRAAK